MAGFPNTIDQRFLIDSQGNPVGGVVYFYLSGTDVLAAVYGDPDLLLPVANPIEVAAGSPVPTVYLDKNVVYRRKITFLDGSPSYDIDPYNSVNLADYLPTTGGDINGDLRVDGSMTATKVIGVSPNAGFTGAVILRDAPGNPDVNYLQFTNNTGTGQYGYIRCKADGTFVMSGGFANKVITKASTASEASVAIPPGVAPTTPANGDVWATTAGLFSQVNGAAQQLLSVASSSLSQNGFIRLNNGLMIQWGFAAVAQFQGTFTVTFPTPFPVACYTVVSTAASSGSGTSDIWSQTVSVSPASFVAQYNTTNPDTVYSTGMYWIAIGR